MHIRSYGQVRPSWPRRIFRAAGWMAAGAATLALSATLIVERAIEKDKKILPMEDFNGTAAIMSIGRSASASESAIMLQDQFGQLLISEREHPVIKGGFLITARNLRPGAQEEFNDTYDKIRVCEAPPANVNTSRAVISQRAVGETLDVTFHAERSHQTCTLSTTRHGTNVTLDCTCLGPQAMEIFRQKTQVAPLPELVPEDSPDFIGPQRAPSEP